MMTREEVLSIEEYCDEHKISHKKRMEELRIPFWNFYKVKQASRLSLLRIKAIATVRFPKKGSAARRSPTRCISSDASNTCWHRH